VVLASTVGVIKARISLHGPCVIRGGNLAPANDQQSACSNFLRCSPTKPRLASTWNRGPNGVTCPECKRRAGPGRMDRTCGGARGSVRCYSQFSNQRFWLEPCFCAAPEMFCGGGLTPLRWADNEPVDGEFRKVMHLSSAGVTEHQRVGCASPSALFLLADPLAD